MRVPVEPVGGTKGARIEGNRARERAKDAPPAAASHFRSSLSWPHGGGGTRARTASMGHGHGALLVHPSAGPVPICSRAP
jgi:hypothetical protein